MATHRPGQLGALVGKRVYSYPTAGNRCVSNGYTVYTYAYDAVGNVVEVFTGGGDEAFFFAQDAFGNELDIASFASDDWAAARDDGIVEHQTGKWLDPFTGQYYFHARWYDSVVGRFTGRDPVSFSRNIFSPTTPQPLCTGGCGAHRMQSNGLTQADLSISAYDFVRSNPLIFADPNGLECCFDVQELEASYSFIFVTIGAIIADVTTNRPCPGTPHYCEFIAPLDLNFGVSYPGFGYAARWLSCCRECGCFNIEEEYKGWFYGWNVSAIGTGGKVYSPGGLECTFGGVGWILGTGFSLSYYVRTTCD